MNALPFGILVALVVAAGCAPSIKVQRDRPFFWVVERDGDRVQSVVYCAEGGTPMCYRAVPQDGSPLEAWWDKVLSERRAHGRAGLGRRDGAAEAARRMRRPRRDDQLRRPGARRGRGRPARSDGREFPEGEGEEMPAAEGEGETTE